MSALSSMRVRSLLFASLLLLVSAPAWAAPVYVESASPDDGRGIVYYGTNDGDQRETWWGGQRLINVSDSPSFNSSYELGVFCFEPFGDLPFENQPLEYTIGTMTDLGFNALQQQRMQLLFDNAYQVLLDVNHPYDFSVRATAFQVVAWEILNDGATANPLSLTSGLTRVDLHMSDNAEIHEMSSLASSWVADLNAGNWSTTGQYQIKVLLSDSFQDLGFGVVVPEPSSVVLAGFGLVSLAVMMGRRARSRR